MEQIVKFDFDQARLKHVVFKSKLRALLYGAAIDIEPILSTTHCSLGKWIYEVALPKIGHIPEVKELEKVHTHMHSIAQRLWKLYQEGKKDEALNGLDQVDETAQKLLQLLDVLEQKATS